MTDEVFTICISNTSKENLIQMLIDYEIMEYDNDDEFRLLPNYKVIYSGNLSGKTHDCIPLAEFLLKMKRKYPENVILVAGKGDIFRLGIEADLSKSRHDYTDDEKAAMNEELLELIKIQNGCDEATDFIDHFQFHSSDGKFSRLLKIMSKVYGCKQVIPNREKYMETRSEDIIVQSFIDEIYGGVLSDYLEECYYCYFDNGCMYTDISIEGLAVLFANSNLDENASEDDVFMLLNDKIGSFVRQRENPEPEDMTYSPLMMQVLCDSQTMFNVTGTTCLDTRFMKCINAERIVISGKTNSTFPIICPIENKKVLYPTVEGGQWVTLFAENDLHFLGKVNGEDYLFSTSDTENVGDWTLSLHTKMNDKEAYHYSKFMPDGSFSLTTRATPMVAKTPISQKRKVMFSPKKTVKGDETENFGRQTPPSTLYSRGGRNSISSPTSSPRRQNEQDDIIVTGFEDSDEEN